MTLPGWRLRAWAVRWCNPRTMTHLVDPILADLQVEHHEALMRGSVWRSRLAWLRAILALARAGAVHSTGVLASAIFVRPYEERRLVSWALVVTAAALVMFAAILSAPLAWSMDLPWPVLAYLLPSAIPVVLPPSLVCGIVFGLGAAQRRLRCCIVAFALAASCTSLYLVASVVPVSSQSFREEAMAHSGRPSPLRGVNELTLSELRLLLSEPRHVLPTGPVSSRGLTTVYHRRWSLACAPLMMVLAILSMAGGRRWVNAVIAVAVILVHFASPGIARVVLKAPIAVAWAPNLILLLTAIGAMLVRLQRPVDLDAGSGSAPRSASMT